MGYRMNGSPAKLGTIQGTSGHKAALEEASPNKFNAAALTKLATTAQKVGQKVGKVVKKGGKFLKGIVTKKGGKGASKTSIPKEINVKGAGKGATGFASETPSPPGSDIKTITTTGDTRPATTEKPGSGVSKGGSGKPKMQQQINQEKRLAKVSARRRSKGKGKSMREAMLEKKVAMTPDERIRWNQAQTKQYIDLGLKATSVALGGGHGGGYSSGGADFSKTLPSEGERAQRSGLGTGFQTTSPKTTPGGTEYTVKGEKKEEEVEKLSDKDKYLYS